MGAGDALFVAEALIVAEAVAGNAGPAAGSATATEKTSAAPARGRLGILRKGVIVSLGRKNEACQSAIWARGADCARFPGACSQKHAPGRVRR